MYAGLFMVSMLVLRAGGSITIGDLLLITSFGLTAADAVISGRRIPLAWGSLVALALILVGGCITAAVADDPPGSLFVLARILFLAFLVPWAMGVLLSTPRRVRTAVVCTAAGAAICAGGAILQLLFGNVIPGSEVTTGGRFPGFAVHVSDTGGIACLAVVYGAGLLLDRGKASKLWGFGIFFVGLSGLILSGSVSGMLAAGTGGLVLLLWHRVRPLKLALIAAALFFTGRWALEALSTAQNALTPLERLLQVTGATARSSTANTSSSRWETIVAGWKGFVAHPLTGAGLEPEASLTFGDLPAHNIVVAALFQGGALFALGLGIVAYRMVRPVLAKRLAGGTVTIAAAGTVTAVLFAMTAPSFYNRYFWLPVALGLVASRIKGPKSRLSISLRRPSRVPRPTLLHVQRRARATVEAGVPRAHPSRDRAFR